MEVHPQGIEKTWPLRMDDTAQDSQHTAVDGSRKVAPPRKMVRILRMCFVSAQITIFIQFHVSSFKLADRSYS
jgi:hypothetical protein